jgi:hypothetical protein
VKDEMREEEKEKEKEENAEDNKQVCHPASGLVDDLNSQSV